MFRRLIAAWYKPNKKRPDLFRCIDCGGLNKALDLTWGLCEKCRWRAWKDEADDRMRSLSVRTPERDADFWDIANHEPEAGRVEYRFLGITGFEDE